MTEKIIINGVDVAGCNFRLERDNKQKCECCHATGFGVICNCEAWHNCYYKQLQGIKQQNLELIERANAYPKIVTLANERLNEIARLEQENKELKEIINKSARSFCNDYLKTFEENKFLNNQIMEVKFNAQQEIEFLTEENNNYHSALEEIREDLETQVYCECSECGNDDYSECIECMTKRYMEKINEVLDNEKD